MAKEQNYYKERDKNNFLKLQKVLKELPLFTREFFLGIESRTTVLTRLNYAYDLRTFFEFLCGNIEGFVGMKMERITVSNLEMIDISDIELFLSYLSYYLSPDGKEYNNSDRAKARKLSSVRALFKYFFNKGKLSKNVAAKVPLPKLHDKEIVRLNSDEVTKLLDEIEAPSFDKRQKIYNRNTKIRDNAIITLFLGTGIRISELVGLNVEDLDFSQNAFTVTRKGGNRTILFFTDEIAAALYDYLDDREKRLLKSGISDESALFLSLQNKRLCVRAVENIVKKYNEACNPLKKITPHKLRSTFGTELYRATQDIYVVAEILGHKDLNTTRKHYAAISEDIKREAAKKVKLKK